MEKQKKYYCCVNIFPLNSFISQSNLSLHLFFCKYCFVWKWPKHGLMVKACVTLVHQGLPFSQILLQDPMSFSMVIVIIFLWGFSKAALLEYLDSYCCNFLGFLTLLSSIRLNNDLGHPLCNNLRQGNWMIGEFLFNHNILNSYRLDDVNTQEFCLCACSVCVWQHLVGLYFP